MGLTGGGKEAGMMYMAGAPDHKVSNADMIEHIVSEVEKKADALRSAREAEEVAAE